MNTVKSDIVYNPQAFLEDLLRKCYFFGWYAVPENFGERNLKT